MSKSLTPLEQAVADEYLIDFIKCKAMQRAQERIGHKSSAMNVASAMADEYFERPRVQQALAKVEAERRERVQID